MAAVTRRWASGTGPR